MFSHGYEGYTADTNLRRLEINEIQEIAVSGIDTLGTHNFIFTKDKNHPSQKPLIISSRTRVSLSRKKLTQHFFSTQITTCHRIKNSQGLTSRKFMKILKKIYSRIKISKEKSYFKMKH